MTASVKSAFLVPFFGDLPPYFDFWAQSCEANHEHFHWFVYNDQISSRSQLNKAVTLIPYQFEEMKADLKSVLDLNIPGKHLRRVCDYRLLFYWIRREEEALDTFDFIGFTDMDMVYGELMAYMPENPLQYGMISADDDRPCGPFTLMKRDRMELLRQYPGFREEMERVEHRSFNEAVALMEIFAQDMPVHCRADELQPGMASNINSVHLFGVWDRGRVTVTDCWRRQREGGFYHFSRYKDKDRFAIDSAIVSRDQWAIHKFGICDPKTLWNRVKMTLSLYI